MAASGAWHRVSDTFVFQNNWCCPKDPLCHPGTAADHRDGCTTHTRYHVLIRADTGSLFRDNNPVSATKAFY